MEAPHMSQNFAHMCGLLSCEHFEQSVTDFSGILTLSVKYLIAYLSSLAGMPPGSISA